MSDITNAVAERLAKGTAYERRTAERDALAQELLHRMSDEDLAEALKATEDTAFTHSFKASLAANPNLLGQMMDNRLRTQKAGGTPKPTPEEKAAATLKARDELARQVR